jgi:hypothetical protein
VEVDRRAAEQFPGEKIPTSPQTEVGTYDGNAGKGSGSVTIVSANTSSVVPRKGTSGEMSP